MLTSTELNQDHDLFLWVKAFAQGADWTIYLLYHKNLEKVAQVVKWGMW